MKLSFRILLALPLLFSAALVSCTSSGFSTPSVHGKVNASSGSEPVSIPHGISAL